jgi:1,4-alpha-glucan branching enzyme
VPRAGAWREIMNTDSQFYGGSNVGNEGTVHALAHASHGEPQSITLTLPPLSTIMFRAEA